MRLSNGHSLYRQHKSAVDIASGLPQALSLVQPKGLPAAMAVAAVAAKDVFCGLQVTEFDSFLSSFLCHFILLSNLVWPSVNFHLENSFLAVH